jgi:DNA modification methylase
MSIKWHTEKRKLADLIPAAYNPRKLSDEQKKQLNKSLTKFGYVETIDINTDNTVIGGHQRLEVLADLGYDEIEVRVPERKLTKKEEKELNLRLNKNLGEFDYDLLGNGEFEIELLEDVGFDAEELESIFPDELGENEVVEDEPPAVDDVEPIAKLGDLWQLGRHRLLCGDCTIKENVELLLDNQKINLLVTDPPYGINVVKNKKIGGRGAFGGKKNYNGSNNIKANNYPEVLGDNDTVSAKNMYDLCILFEIENKIIWGGNYFTDFLPVSRGWLAWDKIDGVEGTTKNFSDIELAWTTFNKPARIFRHRWQGLLKASEHTEKRVHPTQKPIALIAECLKYYEAGEKILDPFLGSGSTLIACEQTDRICYGCELEPAYVSVTILRWIKFMRDSGKENEIAIHCNGKSIDYNEIKIN